LQFRGTRGQAFVEIIEQAHGRLRVSGMCMARECAGCAQAVCALAYRARQELGKPRRLAAYKWAHTGPIDYTTPAEI
jgi:hypothetical protein